MNTYTNRTPINMTGMISFTKLKEFIIIISYLSSK